MEARRAVGSLALRRDRLATPIHEDTVESLVTQLAEVDAQLRRTANARAWSGTSGSGGDEVTRNTDGAPEPAGTGAGAGDAAGTTTGGATTTRCSVRSSTPSTPDFSQVSNSAGSVKPIIVTKGINVLRNA